MLIQIHDPLNKRFMYYNTIKLIQMNGHMKIILALTQQTYCVGVC